VNIALAAVAALRNQQFLAVTRQIANDLIGICITHDGADWDTHSQVVAAAAVTLPTHAVFTTLGAKMALMAKIDERIQTLIGDQINTAAIAAIAAVRTAERDELLAPKTDATIASAACKDLDSRFIDELHVTNFLGPGNKKPRSRRGSSTHDQP